LKCCSWLDIFTHTYTLHTPEHLYLSLCMNIRYRMVRKKALHVVRAHTIRDACTPPSHPDADGGRGRFTLPLTAPLTQVTGRLASNKSASSGRIAMQYQRGHRCKGQTLCNNPTYRHWRNWCSENTGRRFNRITHYRAETTTQSGM